MCLSFWNGNLGSHYHSLHDWTALVLIFSSLSRLKNLCESAFQQSWIIVFWTFVHISTRFSELRLQPFLNPTQRRILRRGRGLNWGRQIYAFWSRLHRLKLAQDHRTQDIFLGNKSSSQRTRLRIWRQKSHSLLIEVSL